MMESRSKLPVYKSSRGRPGKIAEKVACDLSKKWAISLAYAPGSDTGGKQGIFYLDASELNDLEIEGVRRVIHKELARYIRGNDQKQWKDLFTT